MLPNSTIGISFVGNILTYRFEKMKANPSKITIFFFTLAVLCVSTVYSVNIFGCDNNQCWKYCVKQFTGDGQIDVVTNFQPTRGSSWCYTTTWKEPQGQIKKCKKDSDCNWVEHTCAGACSNDW